MGHRHFGLPLLAACAAAAVASAQPQPAPLPQTAPPADPTPRATERPDVSDAQLGLEVQARLYQELDVSNLSALVRYGVATLDGMVRTEADRQRAEQLALEIRGVESVVNELSVATPVTVAIAEEAAAIADREDANIEAAVSQRLRSDAVIGSRPIQVEADELTNTVTLRGTVATEDEKERAGQIAVAAFPTGQVRNQLEVRQRL
jgi:osmotically-inducible protein OsmY